MLGRRRIAAGALLVATGAYFGVPVHSLAAESLQIGVVNEITGAQAEAGALQFDRVLVRERQSARQTYFVALLSVVDLVAGETIPWDRAFAVENGPSGFNPASPSYFPKQRFLMLMKNARLDDDTLLRALRDACLANGGLVSGANVTRYGGRSPAAYMRRWGRWRNALVALREWVERHDPGFAYIAALPD